MKIKTNRDQLDGLVLILSVMMTDNPPRDIAEELVFDHVKTAYNKMRVKSELLSTPRSGWGIILTDQEARALYLFVQNSHIPEQLYRYEAIQINSIINQIDERYAHTPHRIAGARC